MSVIDYTRPPAPPPPPQGPAQRGWFARNWGWVLLLGCLVPLLLCGGGVAGVVYIAFKAMRSSAVYTEAVSRATSNPEVRQRLGEPVVPKWWLSGNIKTENGEGFANIRIPIAGPKGSGTIYAVARQRTDRWQYETLEVEIGDDRINVLESSSSPPESTDTAPPGG
jgi:hypothetical protein